MGLQGAAHTGAWMQHQDLGPPPPTDPTSGLPGPLLPHFGNRRRGKRHLGWTTWLTHLGFSPRITKHAERVIIE